MQAAAFKLDTSGAIRMQNAFKSLNDPQWWPGGRALSWFDLSPFEQGYIEAALRDLHSRVLGAPFDEERVRFDNLAPETLAAIRKDCKDVQEVAEFFADDPGASFWLNRQATWPAWATSRLHLMRRFPPLVPYLSDDGKVCLREASK